MAVLATEGLGKRYGTAWALRDLDLALDAGEVLGYLGPSGAGKTATIRLVLGLLRPTAGRATIYGFDAVGRPVEAHRQLAYVPGKTALWPSLTGADVPHLLARVRESPSRAHASAPSAVR
jgi:ABC-2 type transport system ATP-binding protein